MAEEFVIKRAERKQARLRLAICATSNGGKTWTSLELAFGIVEEFLTRKILPGTLEGKVGLVDTERRSGHLYSHLGPYDVVELGPPFTVERYIAAQRALERAGCEVIILDSISHAWMGQGGVLALLDRFEAKDRFSQFGKTLNPAQDEFVDSMLRSPAHIIATMRSKTAWVIEDVERNGRTIKAPRRIGLAPIQRPGIEFEFTTMLDLETDSHFARVVKNRCPVFQDWQPKKISREHGRALASWLLEGAPEPVEPLSGTPLERAQATCAAAVRAVHRAENQPDLARVFTEGDKAIRAFVDTVDREELAALRRALANEKDLRKKQLGAPGDSPPAAGMPIELAMDIEGMLQAAGIPIADFTSRFDCMRIGSLPASKVQDAVTWIAGAALDRGAPPPTLTKRLVELGITAPIPRGSPFADMVDDLPWKD